MALIMTRWGQSPDGQAQWRIGTEDGSSVRFPSGTQIEAILRRQTSCKEKLVVLERQSNNILVQASAHLDEQACKDFLAELWWGMVFE